jgi:error-prone DNA polymerase
MGQPMGFYAAAQIVRDAKAHGVAVRPVDVTISGWDSTLEPDAASTDGLALRLGLRVAGGLSEEESRALAALADADSFAGLTLSRPRAHWAALGIDSKAPKEFPLFAGSEGSLLDEPEVVLPGESAWQAVARDYQAIGLTMRQHSLALLRPTLERLGLSDTRRCRLARQGQSIRLPGLVLMRQRPGTAKGVVFVTVEDEFGEANLVVYAQAVQQDRRALLASRLLVARGHVKRVDEHAAAPILHLIARRLVDRSELLDVLHQRGERVMPAGRIGPSAALMR